MIKNLILKQLKTPYRGFTLIELLVVILILGILAGVAFPAFFSQADKAREVEAKNQLDFLKKSQLIYYGQSDEYTSSFADLGFNAPTETENYHYEIFSENNYLQGSIHAALSKKSELKSYAVVVYSKNGQPVMCRIVEVPVKWPLNPLQLLPFLNQVISNPNQYC